MKKKENVVRYFIVMPIMVAISYWLLSLSYEALRCLDLDFGLYLMFLNIFVNIILSQIFSSTSFIKSFWIGASCFYTFFLYWACRRMISNSLLMLVLITFLIVLIFGIHYALRIRNKTNVNTKDKV